MGKRKILLIDDEESFGFMIKLNLEQTGMYDVRVETQGKHALKTVRQFMPDIIFLDLVMPDVDGTDVACQIKTDEKLKDIPLVFLTAAVTKEETTRHDGVIGGRPFLAKPVKVKDVIECIEKALSK